MVWSVDDDDVDDDDDDGDDDDGDDDEAITDKSHCCHRTNENNHGSCLM